MLPLSGNIFLSRPPTRKSKCRKSKFTAEEDERLTELVNLHGIDHWNLIAAEMENRNIRQCRERWKNYLDPNLKIDNWTEEEDNLLLEKYSEIGPHWNLITQYFEARSSSSVRNRLVRLQRTSSKLILPKVCDIKQPQCLRFPKLNIIEIPINQTKIESPQINFTPIITKMEPTFTQNTVPLRQSSVNIFDTTFRPPDFTDMFTEGWTECEMWDITPAF